jgi:hypothetical protein
MQTFEFFIEDDRYTVPSLELVQARDADSARQLAADRLAASSHHESVEVRIGVERLFLLTRGKAPSGADEARQSAY